MKQASARTTYVCQQCGFKSPKWQGKCPDCENWNSLVEEIQAKSSNLTSFVSTLDEPVRISEIESSEDDRLSTDIGELDRVLGGGIVSGSVTLIGGDPGIGKSTLGLQIAKKVADKKKCVLYISAEESIKQTKLRADRLKANADTLYIVNQTDLSLILEYVKKLKPDVLVIDSIQVIFHPQISSSPGSVSQVRESTSILTRLAKTAGISLFIIGHVTKEGSLAGPRVLEHLVDTVLYFEGEKYSIYRILRSIKNRFGSTNEIGVFEMTSSGLMEVSNPSQVFLSERSNDVSGSCVVPVLEGTRPLLIEIQALVTKASFGMVRRRSIGFDYNRTSLLVAVLERRVNLRLGDQDIFVNIVGGVKVEDPAADLALVLAVASGFKDKAIPKDTVALGEVGLSSEIRGVSYIALRINEAARLGYKRAIIPKQNFNSVKDIKGIKICPAESVNEALNIAL